MYTRVFLLTALWTFLCSVQVILGAVSITQGGLVIAKQNTSITLTCQADYSGNQVPLLSWHINHETLSTGDKYNITDTTEDMFVNKTLTISNLDELVDSGVYTCENKRPSSANYKADVELVVYTVPMITTNGDKVLTPNEDILLICYVTGDNFDGVPYVWKKDGKVLANSPGVYDLDGNGKNDTEIFTNSSLNILDANEDDLGLYECSVEFFVRGRVVSESSNIRVFDANAVKDSAISPRPNVVTMAMAVTLVAISTPILSQEVGQSAC